MISNTAIKCTGTLSDTPKPDMADVRIFDHAGERDMCDKADDAANPREECYGDGYSDYAY